MWKAYPTYYLLFLGNNKIQDNKMKLCFLINNIRKVDAILFVIEMCFFLLLYIIQVYDLTYNYIVTYTDKAIEEFLLFKN